MEDTSRGELVALAFPLFGLRGVPLSLELEDGLLLLLPPLSRSWLLTASSTTLLLTASGALGAWEAPPRLLPLAPLDESTLLLSLLRLLLPVDEWPRSLISDSPGTAGGRCTRLCPGRWRGPRAERPRAAALG